MVSACGCKTLIWKKLRKTYWLYYERLTIYSSMLSKILFHWFVWFLTCYKSIFLEMKIKTIKHRRSNNHRDTRLEGGKSPLLGVGYLFWIDIIWLSSDFLKCTNEEKYQCGHRRARSLLLCWRKNGKRDILKWLCRYFRECFAFNFTTFSASALICPQNFAYTNNISVYRYLHFQLFHFHDALPTWYFPRGSTWFPLHFLVGDLRSKT